MPRCTHCERDLSDRRPLSVEQESYAAPIRVGRFCSYDCLARYVDERELADAPDEPVELRE